MEDKEYNFKQERYITHFGLPYKQIETAVTVYSDSLEFVKKKKVFGIGGKSQITRISLNDIQHFEGRSFISLPNIIWSLVILALLYVARTELQGSAFLYILLFVLLADAIFSCFCGEILIEQKNGCRYVIPHSNKDESKQFADQMNGIINGQSFGFADNPTNFYS